MPETAPKPKRSPGRPRKHADDADKNQAYRDRLFAAAAEAEMLRKIIDTPTPEFLHRTGRRAMKWAQAHDRDLPNFAVELFASFLSGIEAEAGKNASEAILNFVRYEIPVTVPKQDAMVTSEAWEMVS